MDQQDTIVHNDEFANYYGMVNDLVTLLAQRGCPDLTSLIDLAACTSVPSAGGGYSDVYKGALHNSGRVAIKSYRIYEELGTYNPHMEKHLKRTARESYIWSHLRHPNVLPLMGVALFRGRLSIVTKWMENGTLSRFIRDNPKANRFRLSMDVCAGLCYLHDSGVVHGDLKAANIIVSSEGTAMIEDFGSSTLSNAEALFETDSERAFSIRWAAPELFAQSQVPKTRASDVYAYGMTLLEIITGEVPFPGMTIQRVLINVTTRRAVPERPSFGLDDVSWALLLSCWAHSPSDRPTARDIRTRLQAILHDWESGPYNHGSNPWYFLGFFEQVEPPTQAPNHERDYIIGTNTPTEDIIALLVENGCTDLTSAIDHSLCGQNPYTAGGFGDIYRGALNSGATVAIKILLLRTDSVEIDVQGKIQKRTARELYHWARLKHPNVLPLTGFALFRGQVSMVSEWMQGGSIVSYLESNPNANRIQLCVDICAGLSYIHEEDMVHGDLKAANVMVSAAGAAMIGDFGNSDLEELQRNFTRTTQRPGVSIRWASPELLLEQHATPNKESDVYAYGMTVLETITGNFPFKGLSMLEVMLVHQARELHPRPLGMNDHLWDVLVACWDPDVGHRATIATIMTWLEPLAADAGAIYSALREQQNLVSAGSTKVTGTKSKQADPAVAEESDYVTRPPGTTMSYYEHYTRSLPGSGLPSYTNLAPNPEYVTAPEMNTVYYTAPLGLEKAASKGGDDECEKHG